MGRQRLTIEQQRQGRALGVQLSAMRGAVTQADLADRAGMSLDTLRKIELGKVAGPSFFFIGQIVDAAGGRLDSLWAEMQRDAAARERGGRVSVAAADVLRPAPWSKSLSRWWRGADLQAVASLVASEAGLRGQLLPYTRVDGRPAFPVAVIDDGLATQRLQRDQWPILDRGVLKEHASTGFAEAPPEAVALAGFIVVEPFRVARQHLAGLRTWAPTVAAVPAWRPLDALSAAECDYYGYRVVITDGADTSPLGVDARPRREPSRYDPWRRLRDEQMFQLALECGLLPSRSLVPLHDGCSVPRLS